jgi:hypothetical protein
VHDTPETTKKIVDVHPHHANRHGRADIGWEEVDDD